MTTPRPTGEPQVNPHQPRQVKPEATHEAIAVDLPGDDESDFPGWPAIPTRVLAGAQDRFFPVEFQRALARDRLGVDADVLPGGHLIALAQPVMVANYLLQR
ncbi:MAG TPA: hypothetical protein VHY21_18450 [Pseudonocardiaceae bacterium]|nr:hypothetical protein [Pseudonocardiaceae bacterium]